MKNKTKRVRKLESRLEEHWDYLCSNLGILEAPEKQDIVREYGKIMKALSAKEEREKVLEEIRQQEIANYMASRN